MLTSSKVLRSFDEQTSRRCSGAIAPALYKLTVPADGHYAIFLQHMIIPSVYTNGDHVEAEAIEKAGEEAKPAKGSQVGIVCTLLVKTRPRSSLSSVASMPPQASLPIVLALTVLHLIRASQRRQGFQGLSFGPRLASFSGVISWRL